MKHVTIIPSEGQVYVDGACRKVDLSGMDPAIHAIQWSAANGIGEVEFVNDPYGPAASYKPNQKIASIAAYQQYVDAWSVAAPST